MSLRNDLQPTGFKGSRVFIQRAGICWEEINRVTTFHLVRNMEGVILANVVQLSKCESREVGFQIRGVILLSRKAALGLVHHEDFEHDLLISGADLVKCKIVVEKCSFEFSKADATITELFINKGALCIGRQGGKGIDL